MIENGKQMGSVPLAQTHGLLTCRAKKILAINFGGIGDEILFLPTLQTIRDHSPDSHITLMLEPRSRSVQELTDLIDVAVTFDIKKRPLAIGDLLELLALIKDGGYDCIISSGSSPLVSALLFLSGVRERVGYGSSALGQLLLTEAVPLNRNQYAAFMYHDLAIGFLKQQKIAPPAVPQSDLIPRVQLNQESVDRMRAFLAEAGINEKRWPDSSSRLILFHPGTSKLATEKGIIKTWATDSWIDLLYLIAGHNASKPEKDIIVLAGGPDDQEIVADILARTADQASYMVSAYGKTKNLSDLAALIHLSDLMVCVDSAPMHVTVGLNKPLVALFGPTNPALLLPRDPKFKSIWDSRNGARSMFDRLGVKISPKEVFQAIVETERESDSVQTR